ncbi:MAG: TonB-dependent receptor, partial [Phycisphaerales bacterium]|nr:TonB-dependent receptor [Phycisphaerales bacterium]
MNRHHPARGRPPTPWLKAAAPLALAAGLAVPLTARADDPADSPQAAPPQANTQPPAKAAGPEATDDLLIFQEIPVVISASRRAQRFSELSVPVSVVTANDIHYRGLTSLAEMLSQVPGMNTLRVDRNRWAVGVRGLHDEYADRTIVLINGRDAGNLFWGAADFGSLPVLTEDVERIEVVRGPGGAVWGANAFNGAINIITRRPEDTTGLLLSSRINNFGDTDNQLRFGATSGALSFKIAAGYQQNESSDDAVSNDDFFSRDFARNSRIDAEADYRFSDQARLRFGAAASHAERGDAEFGELWPRTDERIDHQRLFARLEREFDGGATGYLQWYGNFASENRPALARLDSAEHDLEAQYAWNTSAENRVMVGGNLRFFALSQELLSPQDLIYLPNGDRTESWQGVFVTDRWQVSDRFALEGQFRFDNYSGTKADWSARIAALYALDADQKHVLRIAAAKAFRIPLVGIRDLATQRIPLPSPPAPPDTFGLTLLRPGDLDHERVYTVEAGYTGQLSEHADLRVNAYYNRYTDLVGVVTFNPAPFVGTLDNLDGADAMGVESELTFKYNGG